jgi:cysteine desulfurase
MKTIFLDYAATTPMDPRVREKMFQCLSDEKAFGNPSSPHLFGQRALEWIEEGREAIANLINTVPRNIIFTSNATEANNLALKGVVEVYQGQRKHIITAETEHPSVLEVCRYLEQKGFSVTYLKPGRNGVIQPEAVEAAINSETILVSVMHVNNETGVIQDIARIGEITRQKGIYFHVDAVQALGKLSLDLQKLPVDLMSFSAHKIYGPKGIGALYVNDTPRVRLSAQLQGGAQERKWRAGTLATHQIAGFGEACRILKLEMADETERVAKLSQRFWEGIEALPGVHLNTERAVSLPYFFNLRFLKINEQEWERAFNGLAVSSASACNAMTLQPSFVLRAMGYTEEEAGRSVRFSFGRFTTEEEIDNALFLLKKRLTGETDE